MCVGGYVDVKMLLIDVCDACQKRRGLYNVNMNVLTPDGSSVYIGIHRFLCKKCFDLALDDDRITFVTTKDKVWKRLIMAWGDNDICPRCGKVMEARVTKEDDVQPIVGYVCVNEDCPLNGKIDRKI